MILDFVDVFEVQAIHYDQIVRYGGEQGLRDYNLLESAVHQAINVYNYNYHLPINELIANIASAYAYNLCTNHPFIDGNKRVSAVSMLIFLMKNGYNVKCDNSELEKLFLGIASGIISKEETVDWIFTRLVSKNN